jgi:hypothetical protein
MTMAATAATQPVTAVETILLIQASSKALTTCDWTLPIAAVDRFRGRFDGSHGGHGFRR